MKTSQRDKLRQAVRKNYAEVAGRGGVGCGCSPSKSCCGEPPVSLESLFTLQGYSEEQMRGIPQGANMGLGCGNPGAIAALKPGETVLDLGCGGGLDCFLAARQVGETGRIIGVDMTPEMVSKARENAKNGGYANMEFRLGEIEHLPVADASVDIIISNCVINLSPDKPRVFQEAFRVLRPRGRLAVSDVVATAPLPCEFRNDQALHSACVAGAATVAEIKQWLWDAGFRDIQICLKDESRELIRTWAQGRNVEDYICSATIEAAKPGE